MRSFWAAIFIWAAGCVAPANAKTYNYDVSMNLDGSTITGNIVTSCNNNCFLTGSNIVAYSFQDSSGDKLTGGGAWVTYSDLQATSSGIYFVSNSEGQADIDFASSGGAVPALQFVYQSASFSPGIDALIEWSNGSGAGIGLQIPPDLQIAQFTTAPSNIVAPTPLPDSLPLFANGLGLIGILGWWRKRNGAPLPMNASAS